MANYYDTNPIPPPAGAAKILNPEALKGLSESQIWRRPGTTEIYKLATAPLPPLPMQAGEAGAMTNLYTRGGYSADEAAKRVAELTANRAPAPTGSAAPPNLTFNPTNQPVPTTVSTSPATPTPAPSLGSGSQTQSPVGSQSAFGAAFGQLMAQGQKNQALQDQKNKLIQQLYDRPLTTEELRTLSPAQQEAIRSGDKSLLEFQILTINDMIKGRADENTSALNYMMDGYKLDQEEVNKKREQAFASFNSIIEKYPQIAAELSPEGFAAIQIGEMPPPDDIQRAYVAYRTALGNDTSLKSKNATIEEYEYYRTQTETSGGVPMTFVEYQTAMGSGSGSGKAPTVIQSSTGPLQWDEATNGWVPATVNGKQIVTSAMGAKTDAQAATVRAAADSAIAIAAKVTEAKNLLKNADWLGAIARVGMSKVPGTDSYALAQVLSTLKSNLGLGALQALKQGSGNGSSGLGALSDAEMKLLTDQVTSLDIGLDSTTLSNNLDAVAAKYQKFVDAVVAPSAGAAGTEGGMGDDEFMYMKSLHPDWSDDMIRSLGKTSVGGGTDNARTEQLTSISTDVKWGEGKRKTNVGQCGALVNDVAGLRMGDSLSSKIAVCDFSITPRNVAVGDVFVQSVTNDPQGHGHTGLINRIGQDAKGRYAIVTEANYHLNGKTTHDRKIYLNDSKIRGFAKPRSWNLA